MDWRITDNFQQSQRLLIHPSNLGTIDSRKTPYLYLTIHEKSMGYVLGQHNETEKKEHVIYYLSKKFMEYETNYP